MILDEAQSIKSSASQRFSALSRLHCRNRLLLTGTPIQNTMKEVGKLTRGEQESEERKRRRRDDDAEAVVKVVTCTVPVHITDPTFILPSRLLCCLFSRPSCAVAVGAAQFHHADAL